MIRWMTILLVWMLCFSSARASLERKEHRAPVKSLLSLSTNAAKNDEFRITASTEVLLDGRPCRYEKIPDGATIVLLETTTNESKEISRIHFRSPKRSASPGTTKSR